MLQYNDYIADYYVPVCYQLTVPHVHCSMLGLYFSQSHSLESSAQVFA